MTEIGQVPASGLEEVARRLGTLSPEKRQLFVARLEERGIDLAKLPIVATPRPAQIPQSYAQQRLWLVDQLDPGAALYNLATTLKLRGRLDVAALHSTLDALVARHEVLRTRFVADDGMPVQIVVPVAPVRFAHEDLLEIAADKRVTRARELAIAEEAIAFDLSEPPLLRARLLTLADDEHWLLLTMHHIVTDEWSNTILIGELIEIYDAICAGRPPALAPLRIQYADYTLWQRAWLESAAVKKQLAYWEAELGRAPYVLALPTDLPRPTRPSTVGAGHHVWLGRALKDRLVALAQASDATLFMTVLAGFQILLARYAGQREIRIGVPIANRNRAEVDGVVGFFSNTQVLRGLVRGADSTYDLLHSLRSQVFAAQANQDLPFERLVEALQPERRASQNPLFDVMLSWHREDARPPARGGLALDWEVPPERVAKFDLCLHVTESADGLAAELVYRTDLFEPATIATMGARLEVVLDQMTAHPARPIAALAWLDAPARARIATWQAPRLDDEPANVLTMHDWLRQITHARAEVIAIRAGDQQLTFGELDALANALAHRLLAWGIVPEARVALCLPRACDFVVALIAVLKCGAAYVPLDPKLPVARLRAMVSASGAGVVIGPAELGVALAGVADVLAPRRHSGGAMVCMPVHPDVAAYVMYTSGSTGQPKGVVISHGALVHYVRGMLARLTLPPGASMAMVSTVAADLGNTVLFGALCSGATLHLIPEDDVRDADAVGRYMAAHAVDVLKIVPTHLKGLMQATAPGHALPRHTLILGGEASDWELVRQVRALGTCRVFNHYGPTEATVGALMHEHHDQEHGSATLPLGTPLANGPVHILDDDLRAVPESIVGEIYIGGPAVARGYLDQPALTADRFIPDPFTAGQRLYRTGDRARRLTCGSIEFLGRGDGQIKLRGHRIELEEIRAELLRAEAVADAQVLVGEGTAGNAQLIAYVIPRSAKVEEATLHTQLVERLPAHMVPAELVWIERFPVTANGKLDRAALTALTTGRRAEDQVAPRTELEQAIATTWCETLKLAQVGVHDNFFKLGGDSLLAFQVVALARSAGIALEARDLFDLQTIAALAGELERRIDDGTPAARAIAPPIEVVPRDGALPASFGQERLWFLWRLDPDSTAYNVPLALRLRGRLEVNALADTLRTVAARHEILRTRVVEVNGDVKQVIEPGLEWPIDWTVAELGDVADVGAAVEREAARPFDLEHGPLWRARLFRIAAEDHVLLVVLHHVVSDGWSTAVMVRELTTLFGRKETLPPLAVQYADYAAWQRAWLAGGELDRQLAYWRGQLGQEHPVLELPADRSRPAVASGRGASVTLALETELSAAVMQFAQDEGATLFMVLLAAFDVLLYRHTGQRDLRIGVPNANRSDAALEGLIGFFVNTQVLRAEITPGQDFLGLLAQIRETALAAQVHADIPFEQLVEALNPERSLSHSPLFQIMFNHQRRDLRALVDLRDDLVVEELDVDQHTAQFDLSLDTWEEHGAIAASWTYATDLFDRATIEQLAARFVRVLEEIVAHPQEPVDRLRIATEGELQAQAGWNATERAQDWRRGYAERFEAQVASDGERVAARHDGVEVGYAALNAQANRVAHALVGRGVAAGDLVCVYAERGLGLLAGLIGVLKAGAVYVPLDVRHPWERSQQILRESGARVVLTTQGSALIERCVAPAEVVDLYEVGGQPEGNLGLATHPAQLAYVIYTSGSTGVPKGAMVTMAGMLNNQLSKLPYFGLSEVDVIAQTAGPSFDISVWQLLAGLLCGARIEIVGDDVVGDPVALLRHVRAAGVTVLESVPSLLQGMMSEPMVALPALRWMLPTGEALSPELARSWLSRYPEIPLVNAYGPAECADDVAMCQITEPPAAEVIRMPIGRPTDNTRLHVVDGSLGAVPIGVVGELCVAGVGVGHGYLGDPARTAEAFVPDPFGAAGGRLYRTGDHARQRADGTFEYVGRADQQVKIRGHRIELGEIEARLLEEPEVQAAAVIVREDVPGQRHLVAYVEAVRPETQTEAAGSGAMSTHAALRAELRDRLAAALPDFMVPGQIVVLATLPINANGKIDRRALPVPGLADLAQSYRAPRSALEHQLAAIWASVLGVDRVGLDDSFFALGGHSLLATRVTSRVLQDLGMHVPLRTMFEASRLGAFAERVAAASMTESFATMPAVALPIPRADRSAPLPLSFAQQRQWFLWRLDPGSSAYHMPTAVKLVGDLDPAALALAFAELVDRHEALRTHFTQVGDEVFQVIASAAPVDLAVEDHPGDEPAIRAAVEREVARPFDLEHGPLWRVRLFRLAADAHVLLVVLHHVVSDEVSMQIMIDELGRQYDGACHDTPVQLVPPALQYADYAVWQRTWLTGGELARQTAYWTAQLGAEHPVLELPADRPRPVVQSGRGAVVTFAFDPALSAALRRFALDHDATLFMVLLAAFDVLLYRHTGQTDLRIGVPNANRNRAELERTIGFFVNTQVLRTEVAPARSFVELLGQVKNTGLEAQAHEDLPFEKLVEVMNPPRSLGHSPLFQVMFNHLWEERGQSTTWAGLTMAPLDYQRFTTQFDLTLDTWEEDGAILGAATYACDLFEPATIERLISHFERVLRAVLAAPNAAIARLPLLDDAERHPALTGPIAPIASVGMSALIEAQAARTPDAVAVTHAGQALTYNALNRRANQLARHLRALGVGPDARVALYLGRSPDLLIGALAVLKSGGAYVPLDPGLPRARLIDMLVDSQPHVLLTDTADDAADLPTAALRCQTDDGRDLPDSDLTSNTVPAHLAYCIYTSGSTGRPKGVAVTHRSMVNFLDAMRDELCVSSTDRVLALTPISFDIAALELYLPLVTGARVVLVDRAEAMDPDALLDRIGAEAVTIIQATPATWRMLAGHPRAAETLRGRRLLCGGEALPPDLARALVAIGPVCNLYGPTETTVWTSLARLDAAHLAPVLGGALRNTTLYVLDASLAPVPDGVAGELYIGGEGLARGYWQRPELTADRFLPDPFGPPGARMYRTGDLVRRRAGSLGYLGRIDHQVKLRGHRIELGEIEAQLCAQPDVHAAVVVLREDVPGQPNLIGYVVSDALAEPPLRERLARTLPDYMLPAQIVVLTALPTNANGKVDRRALPASSDAAARAYLAPRDALEHKVAAIWKDVLGTAQVGLDDEFFALGGHSLLATRVIARVRSELGVDVPLRVLFETSRFAAFADQVRIARTADAAIPRADRGAPLPVSSAQLRQWFLWQLDPESTAYHIHAAVRLSGPLSLARLERAFTTLVERHETLRTRFVAFGSEVHAQIDPPTPIALHVAVADDAALAAEVALPFDLIRGPLWRARLFARGANEHVLLVVLHHVIADDTSLQIMIDELAALYTGAELPALAIQYVDYAAWQRAALAGAQDRQLAYWCGQLGTEHPVLALPADHPRPAIQRDRGATLPFVIDPVLTDALRDLARAHGATLFMVLLAAFDVLLYRHTGQVDLRVGVPSTNRARVEFEGLIGFFVSTQVHRIELAPARGFIDLLAQVKRVALEAQAHQDLPFEQLVEALNPPRSLSHSPLFQVLFNHRVVERSAPALSELQITPLAEHGATAQFDLTLDTREQDGAIAGAFTYAADLFEPTTIQRLVAHFERLLRAIVVAPHAPVTRLPLLDDGERQAAIHDHAAGPRAPLDPTSLHDRVAAQAGRTPAVVALRHAGRDVTFAELDRRADQLADRLRTLGVGPDVLVGLFLDRSPELMIGALAILRAGGAYVPLDPDYPRERLLHMVNDAGVSVLVTDRALGAAWAALGTMRLCLIDEPVQAPVSARLATQPAQLAYCIYTSGSTGRPKGVAVSHAAIGNFLDAMRDELCISPADRVLALTPISFDIAALELYLPLVTGARVVLVDRAEAMDPDALLDRIGAEAVTIIQATPATWRMLAGHPRAAEILRGRRLLCGGEALPPDLARALVAIGPVCNLYGPTETTVWSSLARLDAAHPAPVLGGALRNTTLYVLDPSLAPVPDGVAGELYIGGEGLARGYWQRPELTADRFLPDPFGPPGARMYRTGDLVRRRAGSLGYLGRIDHQVKLRGHRIELGEIEAQLCAQPDVRSAAVILREDMLGQPRLVAYVVPVEGAVLDVADLRAALRDVLPEYMVPSPLVELAELPLTPNGKLDRRALPVPEQTHADRVAPRDDLERQLAALWCEVLGVQEVGVHDNFFDLGGHSLIATQLASRIREVLAIALPLRVLFEATSVATLAEVLRTTTFATISDAEVDDMADMLSLLESPE